jgi:hypothetical protein
MGRDAAVASSMVAAVEMPDIMDLLGLRSISVVENTISTFNGRY